MELANRIKELRKRTGFSQTTLAAMAGVSSRTIWRLEKGEQLPKRETLIVVCIILGQTDLNQINLILGLAEMNDASPIEITACNQLIVEATQSMTGLANYPISSAQLKALDESDSPKMSALMFLQQMERSAGFPLGEDACRGLLKDWHLNIP